VLYYPSKKKCYTKTTNKTMSYGDTKIIKRSKKKRS